MSRTEAAICGSIGMMRLPQQASRTRRSGGVNAPAPPSRAGARRRSGGLRGGELVLVVRHVDDLAARRDVRDHAEEAQRLAAGVAEAVLLVGPDEHDVARDDRPLDLVLAVDDDALAGQDEHLVLVLVIVLRRAPTRRDLELAHGEGRRVAVLDEPAHAAADGAADGDLGQRDGGVVLHEHGGRWPPPENGASERTIVTPETGGGREPGCWGPGIGADVGAAHTARGSGGQKLEAAALPGAPQHRSQLAVVLAARVEPDAEAVGARVAADPRDPAGEREGVVRDR